MSRACEHVQAAMGTVVSVHIVGAAPAIAKQRAQQALAWLERVETTCSRFAPDSELRGLCATVGAFVPVSDLLFELVRFSLALSDATEGAFDPTVGASMVALGFDRDWRSGSATSPAPVAALDAEASWRDVELDDGARSIRLSRPLLLDLGAVAKGLAVDLVARDLEDLEHFAIDAGGDLFLSGRNGANVPWAVGVQHPRDPGRLLATLELSGRAVCTSGDYARRTPAGLGHHVLDPRHGHASATGATSVTVVADQAMVADGLSTAAFVLGVHDGSAWLEAQGVAGLLVGADGSTTCTSAMSPYLARSMTHA